VQRVQKVNQADYFLAQVTGVVLFGSILHLEVDRLEDVDIAVQIETKERSIERLRRLNIQRVKKCKRQGQQVRALLERSFWLRHQSACLSENPGLFF
jgi:predicted nucleotidyltransferase